MKGRGVRHAGNITGGNRCFRSCHEGAKDASARETSWTGYSALGAGDRVEAARACRELTGSLYEGLDVTSEVESVLKQSLGETVLLWDGDLLDAFAVCHCGEGTEAGTDNCLIKFAAVRSGSNAGRNLEHLLEACESLAQSRGMHRIEAGVNLGRSQAYRDMLRFGYRTHTQGVAMHRPDSAGYNRPDVYVLDDWR